MRPYAGRLMEQQLLDAWAINNRITLYMLDAISDEALRGVASSGKGRSVGEMFAHVHNTRLMWLQSAAPSLLAGLEKLDKPASSDKVALRSALEVSGEAIGALLSEGLASGRIKGFKPNPVAFFGYIVAHDAYHRGEIGQVLAQSGHPLDQKTSYGMWEWGVR
jgi:uncharacterized damage-inducible protein DinB